MSYVTINLDEDVKKIPGRGETLMPQQEEKGRE